MVTLFAAPDAAEATETRAAKSTNGTIAGAYAEDERARKAAEFCPAFWGIPRAEFARAKSRQRERGQCAAQRAPSRTPPPGDSYGRRKPSRSLSVAFALG